jgi:hypothetical protein
MKVAFAPAALAIVVCVCASIAYADSPAPLATLPVTIVPLGNSGQSGTATLTSTPDNKTQVIIALQNEPASAVEPAHIHLGTCAKLNPKPVYGLNSVTNGTSTTVVDAPLSKIEAGGYAINIHQSAANIGTYVACGDIPAPEASPTMTPMPHHH